MDVLEEPDSGSSKFQYQEIMVPPPLGSDRSLNITGSLMHLMVE